MAIDTHLILGKVKKSEDYVYDLLNCGLTVYVKGTLINKTPNNYAKKNALTFLDTAIRCMMGMKEGIQLKKDVLSLRKKLKKLKG